MAVHKPLIGGFAALITLFVLLGASSSLPSSYFTVVNGDTSNEFALTSHGFSFVEPRRLNADSGTQPDAEKAIATEIQNLSASIDSDFGSTDYGHCFDQRQRYFLNSLSPRAPPLQS
ncbi:hypothetical protein HNQ57_000176 [Zhongshania antarctica]|uniref:Uncharacterized protein n=1 Tax=Zhongshania antarctica TaxID=641702 RepID=A0A840QZN6_9GAMM|nr:hypothetical protein [Zhongshania antarctica]MBB5185917.1 hypothetical protein [Zhongshania antarctica]